MNYLAILGRQPKISIAELEALFSDVKQISSNLATFKSDTEPNIDKLGGSIKIALELDQKPLDLLMKLPKGKITLGLSDYSEHASKKSATLEALKLKKILVRLGRSVRVVENKDAALATATSLHNGLSGKNPRKIELIKVNKSWYRVIGVQDIDAYSRRDQARPARDAKVGMLPPKLAQILINLCGPLRSGATILDPFCGTGVVLQEALLMGYHAYGTDLSDRMVEYSKKNLQWLLTSGKSVFEAIHDNESGKSEEPRGDGPDGRGPRNDYFRLSTGDATSFKWQPPVDAIACECFLGAPMSTIPPEIKLKDQKEQCSSIILGFLKNLSTQIKSGTPVVIAVPAWLRPDGTYSRLEIFGHSNELNPKTTQNPPKKVDLIDDMGYNVKDISREGLIYSREGQIVARDIIILRKK